jgi:hypothetical protein
MESDNETTETAAGGRPDKAPLRVSDFLGAGSPREVGRHAAVSRLPGDSWLWLQLQTYLVSERTGLPSDIARIRREAPGEFLTEAQKGHASWLGNQESDGLLMTKLQPLFLANKLQPCPTRQVRA